MPKDAETLLETRLFRVVRVTQTDTQGGVVTREFVRHPGAVTILPMVDDDHVCLIKNYRVAVDETLIELPAGTLDKDEDPLHTAERELAEETGFRAESIEPLHQFFLSPGILDERMHLYVATGLTSGRPRREAGEKIENFIVPWDEAMAMIHDGRIHDAKSIVGLLYYDRIRRARSTGG